MTNSLCSWTVGLIRAPPAALASAPRTNTSDGLRRAASGGFARRGRLLCALIARPNTVVRLLRQGRIEIDPTQCILASISLLCCLLCGEGLRPTRSRRSPDILGCHVAPIHCLVAAYLGVQHWRYRSALGTLLAGRCPAPQVRRACLSLCSLRLLRRREYAQEQQEHNEGRTTQHHERLAFVLAEFAAGGLGCWVCRAFSNAWRMISRH